MRKYIVIVVLFVTTIGFGQEMPKIIPPSPEAASVFKFTEVPVSLHTGVPNISIPLFEIESGGVTVPISISYHSRGIKVAEVASRVGLGWTLNAGGMISRQVRDLADETRGYLNQNNSVYTYKNNNGSIDFFTSATKRNDIWNSYSGDPSIWYDFIPDQFYFNSGTGLNGKFIFDYKDGKILAQNYSNIEIQGDSSNSEFSGFSMIDGKGNNYIFGYGEADYDVSLDNYIMHEQGNYNRNNPDGQNININSWHLSKIITQTGQEITFIYEREDTQYFRRSYDRYDQAYTIPGASSDHYISIPSQYNCYASETKSVQRRIKEISFDEGKVVFEYHTANREDLMIGGNYLKKVLLYNKKGAIIQQKVLDYEYTNSSDIDSNTNMNYYLRTMDLQASKRLFLKSVQTKYNHDTVLPPYQFEYDSNKLPSRHSNSIDVWGYYNGVQNGQFFPENQTGTGARAVNLVKSGAGLLNKIIHPEGGSTNFYYEHNRVFSNYPKSVVFFDSPNPLVRKEFILTPIEYAMIDSLRNASIYSQTEKVYRKTFTVSNAVVSKFKVKNMMGDENCSVSNNSSCKFITTIRRLEDDSFVYQLPQTPDNQFKEIIKLMPGNYVMVVQPKNTHHNPADIFPNNMDEFFQISMEWLQEDALITDPIYAGGKRIQRIEYRDADDSIKLTKTYDYTDPDTGKSSGVLFGLPNFFGVKTVLTGTAGQTFTIFQPQGNIPGSPLSTYQGDSLGYGVVTEYIGEGANTIGKTVHRFTTTLDTGFNYEFPFHPPTDNEWLRGKELSTIHYKKNDNGSYTQIKKVENEYLYGGYLDPSENKSTPAVFQPIPVRKDILENLNISAAEYFKDKKMFRLPLGHFYADHDFNSSNFTLMYKVYHLTGGTVDLWKTKVTDYFDGGNEMVTTTDYNYQYDNHYNTSFTTQSVSNGDPIITRYYYSTDSEMSSKPVVSKLIEKNMKDILLETRVSRGLLNNLSTQETVYKDWDLNLADSTYLLLPEIIKTSKGTATLEERIKYNAVDATNGNPLEVQQKDGMKISYIWGYNKTQPVAKLENIAYSSIPSTLITAIQNATDSTTGTQAQIITALNALRTSTDVNLQKAMITTLTYKPLVGVSTITDPKGQITTYEYDNFNRLVRVLDSQGNPLTETEYHYKPQN